jgi:hypothetical protein
MQEYVDFQHCIKESGKPITDFNYMSYVPMQIVSLDTNNIQTNVTVKCQMK